MLTSVVCCLDGGLNRATFPFPETMSYINSLRHIREHGSTDTFVHGTLCRDQGFEWGFISKATCRTWKRATSGFWTTVTDGESQVRDDMSDVFG